MKVVLPDSQGSGMVKAGAGRIEYKWRRRIAISVAIIVFSLLGLALMAWLRSTVSVTVDINGHTFAHSTRARTTSQLLHELDISLSPKDGIDGPRGPLVDGHVVTLEVARYVRIVHDGTLSQVWERAHTVGDALSHLGVTPSSDTVLILDGIRCTSLTTLPSPPAHGSASPGDYVRALRKPMVVEVLPLTPVVIHDQGETQELSTASQTVEGALAEAGVVVYLGDDVDPPLATRVSAGMHIHIARGLPVTLRVGGRGRVVRALATTVGELLAELGIEPGDQDRLSCPLDSPIGREMQVSLVRVHDERFLEEIPVDFELVYEPDPEMEIDDHTIVRWGRQGARRRLIQVRYEDEQEVFRQEIEAWDAQDPVDRLIRYGRKITLRTVDTPSGPKEYWRHLRMLATSYSASTAGVSTSSPHYGLTRLGIPARKGLVAVDPRVIGLGQQVYVPGYGEALAADTGGAIKWRRIDLCFEDDTLELWRRWVDVYLLTPIPADDEIRWIIPNYPVEKE